MAYIGLRFGSVKRLMAPTVTWTVSQEAVQK
jgi:hypothetical protein